MKIRVSTYALAMAGVFILLASSCQKEDNNNSNSANGVIPPIMFNPNLTYGTMTDQSGNTYKTITIGSQTWMAENLRTTKYRNGNPIPNVPDNNTWASLSTGAYCDINNESSNSKVYGRLYNYYTILDNRNIAPAGWHVATQAEWNTLIDKYAGWMNAGDPLKEKGITHWWSPNSEATNESGFTALPNCPRDVNGDFEVLGIIGNSGVWWCNSGDTTTPIYWNMSNNEANVTSAALGSYRRNGNAIRCVKD